MKNIFCEADKNDIIQRIEKLTPGSKALWGKMDVAQMMAHCAAGTKMTTGEIRPGRASFPFNILGRLIKRKALAEGVMRRNSPTIKEIMIVEPKNFDKEKANFIAAITALYEGGEKGVEAEVHFFFGKMTPMEWGCLNYKHADHHLSQFGV
jgi:hypothetical protein